MSLSLLQVISPFKSQSALSVSRVIMTSTGPSALPQNINSFLSNFNYATSPLDLVQSGDAEEPPSQGRSPSSEVNVRSMKVEPLEAGERGGTEFQAGRLFPGWTMKGKGLDSPRGVHFVSKSKALEHVMANGGLQEEVLTHKSGQLVQRVSNIRIYQNIFKYVFV